MGAAGRVRFDGLSVPGWGNPHGFHAAGGGERAQGTTTQRSQYTHARKGGGEPVNFEKVVFGFFVVLAATLNFGFFVGPIDDPRVHNEIELFAAVIVNLIALVMKFGDRTQIGAIHLATSLVASLQLVAAASLWAYFDNVSGGEMLTTEQISSVVSLSGGALLANIISVTLLVVETVSFRRQ